MKFLIFAGFLLFLSSCAAESQDALKMTNTAGVLENTDWQAVALNDGRSGVVSNQSLHLIKVRFDNGNIHGNASCNQFSGTYASKNHQLHIGQLRATQRACADSALMEQEAYFLQALTQVSQYQIVSGQLKLLDGNGLLMVDLIKK